MNQILTIVCMWQFEDKKMKKYLFALIFTAWLAISYACVYSCCDGDCRFVMLDVYTVYAVQMKQGVTLFLENCLCYFLLI